MIEMNKSKLLLAIFSEMDFQAIPYCIMNGYENYPEEISSDIDIIIPSNEQSRFLEILSEYSILKIVSHANKGVCYTICDKQCDGVLTLLKFDVFSDFTFWGVTYLSENDFLGSRRKYKELFWIPSEDIEFIYYLIKRISKLDITQQHLEKLSKLYENRKTGCDKWLKNFFPRTIFFLIQESISSKSLNFDIRNVRRRLITHNKFKIKNLFSRNIFCEIKRVINRIMNPVGIDICFLGVDGSGKTTIINRITKDLTLCFRDKKYIHFRPSVLWKSRKMSQEVICNPHNQMAYNRLISFGKVIACWLDWMIGEVPAIKIPVIKDCLVIIDRHFFDMCLDPIRYRLAVNASVVKHLNSLLRKPALVFFLDTSPEILAMRKQEIPELELSRLRDVYQNEYKNYKGNAFLINTEKPLPEVVNEIEEIIINFLAKRITQELV